MQISTVTFVILQTSICGGVDMMFSRDITIFPFFSNSHIPLCSSYPQGVDAIFAKRNVVDGGGGESTLVGPCWRDKLVSVCVTSMAASESL